MTTLTPCLWGSLTLKNIMQITISDTDFDKWTKAISSRLTEGWQAVPGTVFIALAGVPGSGTPGEDFSRAPYCKGKYFIILEKR